MIESGTAPPGAQESAVVAARSRRERKAQACRGGATVAYFIIGTLYLCLVSFTTAGALIASLVNL